MKSRKQMQVGAGASITCYDDRLPLHSVYIRNNLIGNLGLISVPIISVFDAAQVFITLLTVNQQCGEVQGIVVG